MSKTNKEIGDIYEKYISNYLSIENINSINWIWNNIPEEHLINSGIIGEWNQYRINRKLNRINKLPDLGCDILYLNENGEYKLIQCKCYSKNSISIDCLAGFNAMMLAYDNLKGIVYYTSKLTSNLQSLKQSYRITYIKKDLENIYNLDNIIMNTINSPNILQLIPRDYQFNAYNNLKFKNRTILQLPCGMGKTLISIMLAKDYKKIIVLSNLKAHCEQNKNRFEEQMTNYTTLLVESGNNGTRDINKIKKIFNTIENFVIFSTYKSLDIIIDLLKDINDNTKLLEYFIIIDEFHNISYNDIYDNIDSPMYKLLNSKFKIMFMSATPRLFNNLNKSDIIDSENNIEEYDDIEIDNNIFGNIDYKYEMSLAIENKFVCDYEIFIPSLLIKASEGIENIYNEMNIKEFDKELSLKARFILKGCLEKGSKKCIIYNKSHIEAFEMKKILDSMSYDYYAIKHTCDTILSTDNTKTRENKLKIFIENKDFSFICSVDILNECIDIPSCDSIFITYTSQSNIKNIQRMCRANRINKDNIYKKANIFLWINSNYNEMGIFMKHIKEFDNNFTINKVKRLNCSSNNNTIMKNELNHKVIKEGIELNTIIIGIKVIKSWDEILQDLINFINNEKKLPSTSKKNDTITINLALWFFRQQKNYKNKINVFKKDIFINKWNNFKTSFSNLFSENTIEEEWIKNYNFVDKYINDNNILPQEKGINSNEETSYLAKWITKQKYIYKDNLFNNDNIYNKWTELRNKYPKKLTSIEEDWDENFKLLEDFIKLKGKLPLRIRSENEKKKRKNIKEDSLDGKWFHSQNKNYNQKTYMFKRNEYCIKFEEFINRYPNLFITNETKWFDKLNYVKSYIIEKGELPNLDWLNTQNSLAKQRIKIFKNDNIFDAWNKFINENKKIFINNEEIWEQKYNLLNSFIEKENRLPIKFKDEIKIGLLSKWIYDQNRFYKLAPKNGVMSNIKYKIIWKKFIDKYIYLFVNYKL